MIPYQFAVYLLGSAVLVAFWYRWDLFPLIAYHLRSKKTEAKVTVADWKDVYSFLNLEHETLFATPEDKVVYEGEPPPPHKISLVLFSASIVLLALSIYPPFVIPFSFAQFRVDLAYAILSLSAALLLFLSAQSVLGSGKKRWTVDLEVGSYRPDRYLIPLKTLRKEVERRTGT